MLCIDDVTFQYLGGAAPILSNASVAVDEGRICLFAGDNGSGKTTLAFIACGVIPHLIKGSFSGAVRWRNTVLSEHNIAALSTVVFQNPYTFFQGITIGDELSLCPPVARSSQDVCGSLLPVLPVDTPLHALSVGQQARVALCSALRQPTPILILDEPFESLDESGVSFAGEALSIEARRGRLIIIVHRWELPFAAHAGNRIFLVRGGKVHESSPANVGTFPTIKLPPSGSVVLAVRGLCFSFHGRAPFSLEDVSLSVHAGEITAIVGPNGCGKSTLLLLLAGLVKRRSGEVCVGGKTASLSDLRAHVRCALQNPESQMFGVTLREELEFGLRVSGFDTRLIRERIDAVREYLPCDLDSDPFRLSYGQKKLLSVLAAFIGEPLLVLLDEPIAGLDIQGIEKFCRLAESFLARGGAIVMTSHNRSEAGAFCTRILQMKGGRLTDDEELVTGRRCV